MAIGEATLARGWSCPGASPPRVRSVSALSPFPGAHDLLPHPILAGRQPVHRQVPLSQARLCSLQGPRRPALGSAAQRSPAAHCLSARLPAGALAEHLTLAPAVHSPTLPPAEFRGSRSCDGGLTNFIPLPPQTVGVRVCCFPSKQLSPVYRRADGQAVVASSGQALRGSRQACSMQHSGSAQRLAACQAACGQTPAVWNSMSTDLAPCHAGMHALLPLPAGLPSAQTRLSHGTTASPRWCNGHSSPQTRPP